MLRRLLAVHKRLPSELSLELQPGRVPAGDSGPTAHLGRYVLETTRGGDLAWRHATQREKWIVFSGTGWLVQPEEALGTQAGFLELPDARRLPQQSAATWRWFSGTEWVDCHELTCRSVDPPAIGSGPSPAESHAAARPAGPTGSPAGDDGSDPAQRKGGGAARSLETAPPPARRSNSVALPRGAGSGCCLVCGAVVLALAFLGFVSGAGSPPQEPRFPPPPPSPMPPPSPLPPPSPPAVPAACAAPCSTKASTALTTCRCSRATSRVGSAERARPAATSTSAACRRARRRRRRRPARRPTCCRPRRRRLAAATAEATALPTRGRRPCRRRRRRRRPAMPPPSPPPSAPPPRRRHQARRRPTRRRRRRRRRRLRLPLPSRRRRRLLHLPRAITRACCVPASPTRRRFPAPSLPRCANATAPGAASTPSRPTRRHHHPPGPRHHRRRPRHYRRRRHREAAGLGCCETPSPAASRL